MRYFYLVTVFLLVSCNLNTTYSNRKVDRDEAEKITNKYYWEVLYGDNDKDLFTLFSDDFFSITEEDELKTIINRSNDEYGLIKEHVLEKWETFIVKGTDSKSEYTLLYNVRREKATTQEIFSMIKVDGEIKIIGFNIKKIASKQ